LILNSAREIPLALAVMVLTVAVAAWMYAPQVRVLQKPWRWLLPTLRSAGLVGLAISIVQPVVRRSEAAAGHGAVVILVDRSRSMSVRDWRGLPGVIRGETAERNAAGSELVDLADCLGKLPTGSRDNSFTDTLAALGRLGDLVGQLNQAKTELDFEKLAGRATDAAEGKVAGLVNQVRDLGTALASQTPDAVKGVAALKDLGPDETANQWPKMVARAVREEQEAQARADRQLYLSNPQVRAACDEVAGESRIEVIERALVGPSGLLGRFSADVPLFGFAIAGDVQELPLRGNGVPVARLGISADGAESDLTGTLQAALARLQSQPVDAVVIFTDGRQAGGDARPPAPGVPVFTAIVPTPGVNWAGDVSVTNISLPQSPFAGQTIDVRADVRGTGPEAIGAVIKVDLKMDGKQLAQKDVRLNADGPAQVSFPLKLDEAGIKRITISAAALPDEATMENNRVERAIKVVAGKARVAMIAGSAGWDYQYVRNCLGRADWVTLKDAIVTVDSPLTLSADEILNEDIVMLFNVPAAALSDEQWEAINRLVKERGGSVLFAGGDAEVLSQYPNHPAIAELWPFTADQRPIWRNWPGNAAGFHLVPSDEAKNVDAINLGEADMAGQWGTLPAFFRYLPVAKTAAARTLLVERDSGDAVLTDARVGRGRVLVFGADETWRWREKIGERDQDRFWLQLVRYAMEEPYAGKGTDVELDADPVEATPGEVIKLRGKVLDSSSPPVSLTVEVSQGGTQVKTVQLMPANAGGPGRYEGSAGDLPVGNYVLRLNSPSGENPAEVPLKVAENDEAEMADISSSDHPLSDIAAASGGAVIPLDQVGTLPERIAKAHEGEVRVTDHPLWDSPWLFLFVLACFAVEWAMRKRLGLA